MCVCVCVCVCVEMEWFVGNQRDCSAIVTPGIVLFVKLNCRSHMVEKFLVREFGHLILVLLPVTFPFVFR